MRTSVGRGTQLGEMGLTYRLPKLSQFLTGLRAVPVPISDDAVVISDNADIYGTVEDLEDRLAKGDD